MDKLFDLWNQNATTATNTKLLPHYVREIMDRLGSANAKLEEIQVQQWIQIGIGAAITVLLLLIYLELRKQRKEKTKGAEDNP